MLFKAVARPVLRTSAPVVSRSFSVAAARMGEGDLGGTKKGGYKEDNFSRREAAQETIYVREKELEKLRILKAKLKEQRAHLDELDKHLDELARSQGGEQN